MCLVRGDIVSSRYVWQICSLSHTWSNQLPIHPAARNKADLRTFKPRCTFLPLGWCRKYRTRNTQRHATFLKKWIKCEALRVPTVKSQVYELHLLWISSEGAWRWVFLGRDFRHLANKKETLSVSTYRLDAKKCNTLLDTAIRYYSEPELYEQVDIFNNRSSEFDIEGHYSSFGIKVEVDEE